MSRDMLKIAMSMALPKMARHFEALPNCVGAEKHIVLGAVAGALDRAAAVMEALSHN